MTYPQKMEMPHSTIAANISSTAPGSTRSNGGHLPVTVLKIILPVPSHSRQYGVTTFAGAQQRWNRRLDSIGTAIKQGQAISER